MRSYSHNSPEAAARIVALLLISDGNVSRQELEALYGQDIERQIGLAPGGFGQVLNTLCEDLLMVAHERRVLTGSIDQATLDAVMAEVTEPDLQHKVLYFADAAAMADSHVAAEEAWIMRAALTQWRVSKLPAQG
ncbi:TerB family tellurite resistance protein [Acidovorax sp. LjRoot117]|uniref:TerB family tellurite resistance protein n=1 Tax=Acidovorax sp. LjRoot117 TaxID=3342255 RepID=UPI003ECD1B4B